MLEGLGEGICRDRILGHEQHCYIERKLLSGYLVGIETRKEFLCTGQVLWLDLDTRLKEFKLSCEHNTYQKKRFESWSPDELQPCLSNLLLELIPERDP